MTLTAPGVEVLPWDRELCNHSEGVECSGDRGCRVEALALAAWHADIGVRWNRLITDLRRMLGLDVQYFKTWEEQQRGALHAHVMMRALGVCSDARYRRILTFLARRHGFGSQIKVEAVDLGDERTAARVAGYVAKYAAKNADALPLVRRLDLATGEIVAGGIRSWSSSWRWGERMADCQARRRGYRSGVGGMEGGCSLRATSSQGAPPSPAPVGLDLYCESYAGGSAAMPVEGSPIAV